MFLYRYENRYDRIVLHEYRVIRETEHGYWIAINLGIDKKWVSGESRKRYAYPTLPEAIHNFICRKRRELQLLRGRIASIEDVLHEASSKDFQ